MKDFLLAAAPWIAMGLTLAIFMARDRKKKGKNHESEGIALGMCLGVAVGSMFEGGLAIGISVGMLLGLCIGSAIPRNENSEEG